MKMSEERGSKVTSNYRRLLTSLKGPLPWELVPGIRFPESVTDDVN